MGIEVRATIDTINLSREARLIIFKSRPDKPTKINILNSMEPIEFNMGGKLAAVHSSILDATYESYPFK